MKYNLFYQFYDRFLKGILRDKSEPIVKYPDETRFACGVAAVFLFLAFLLFYFWELATLAWVLVGIVVLLSFFAGLTGLCVGSLMYVFFKKIFSKKG